MGQSASLTVAALLAIARPAALPADFSGLRGPKGDPAPTQEQKSTQARRDPGPRTTVAGITGFDCTSKVRFAASPEIARDLKVTCAFPERMRWMMSAQVDGLLVRELQYRYGDGVYRIPEGTAKSQSCEGEGRAEVLRRLQLRLATMLYPDGFEWKVEGDERTTDLGSLGSLRARGSAESAGRPASIDCIDAEGRTLEGYRAITWRKDSARQWPASLEYWRGTERIWSEVVGTVDTSVLFVDSFFLPPDLREGTTARPVGGGVRTLEIPDTSVLRAPIAAGTTWEAALRALDELRSSQAERIGGSGLQLEEIATFDVSDQGTPVAAVIRLTSNPEKLPEGFVKDPERRGLAVAVEGLGRIDATAITELRRGLPQGSTAGRPYVRFERKGEPDRRVVLVMPFESVR